MNKYIVSLQPNPSREELEWAWKFTVFARVNGHCQHCGKQVRLDACHIKNREQYPELQYEPENGIALCRGCHMAFDHHVHNRPSGRPLGYELSIETKQIMSQKSKASHNTSEYLQGARIRTLKQWDKQGRKVHNQYCKRCGKELTLSQQRANNKFCSPFCHYQYHTGKPRGFKSN
jgi:hypothetical protein